MNFLLFFKSANIIKHVKLNLVMNRNWVDFKNDIDFSWSLAHMGL